MLVLAVAAISLMGAEMFILTGIANTMLFESDTAYLGACERNLVTSGLAWARQNVKSQSEEIFDRTIELDVTNMDVRGASLSVTIAVPTDKQAQAQIRTSCSRRRRTLRHRDEYHIAL